ncbi:MAG: hypothetical protein AAF420_05745, partial [Pseudomonadota bacterium]
GDELAGAVRPDELDNLASSESQSMRIATFKAIVEDNWDLAAIDSDIRQSQAQRQIVSEALKMGAQHEWNYQPQPDYSSIYVRDPSGAELADRKVRVAAKGYPLPGS